MVRFLFSVQRGSGSSIFSCSRNNFFKKGLICEIQKQSLALQKLALWQYEYKVYQKHLR